MARASTRTILSLERFAQVLGISPLEINQITGTGCGNPMFQYAWQHPGRIGREDLAYAIQNAEDIIFDFLGFYPGVVWSEEVFPISPRARNALTVTGLGMFIEGGQRASDLIDDEADVIYDDSDDDDYDDRATITVTVPTGTDPDEIKVFYPGHSGEEAWEIRPLSVSVSGTTATITGKSWQFTTEALQEMLEPDELDRADATIYLEDVEIYRVYNDPSQQAQFEGHSYSCYACSGSGCVACTTVEQTACIRSVAPSQGVLSFIPATWNADLSAFAQADWTCNMGRPARIRAWLRSGWRDPRRTTLRNTILDPRVERAIAVLTMGLIGEEGLCTCLAGIHNRWAIDRAATPLGDPDGGYDFKLSQLDLRNAFGTTNGAYEAWRLLREVRNGRAAI